MDWLLLEAAKARSFMLFGAFVSCWDLNASGLVKRFRWRGWTPFALR
jgi:hypothetical protein